MMRLHKSESDGTLREETIEVFHFDAVMDGSAIAAVVLTKLTHKRVGKRLGAILHERQQRL
jgi:hypothetical protein